MKPAGRIGIRLLALLGLLLTLSGCWDQRPVETRAAVVALGIDPGRSRSLFRYTFVFPNVTTTATSLAATPSSQEFFTVTVESQSLTGALSAAQQRQSRSLYLGQVRLIALSTRLPVTVWRNTLNSAVQSGRFVLTFWLVGTSHARRLVSLSPPSEVVPEVAVYRALSCHCQPIRWTQRAWRLWVQSQTPGITPWVPAVSTEGSRFLLHGLDVIGPTQVESWNRTQTGGWGYLTGRVRNGFLTMHQSGGQSYTVGQIHGRSALRIVTQAHGVDVQDSLRYTGVLEGNTVGSGWSGTFEHQAEMAAAHHILRLAVQAWQKARATHTDPFGWHRDWRWQDEAGALRHPSATGSWQDWNIRVAVHFRIRNEGVVR
ncbi:MAG: hypothetical protein M0Z53_12910 [Thermaerobacter sp.]|nr:hypothetical protein [Thermaerobacter sp.]